MPWKSSLPFGPVISVMDTWLVLSASYKCHGQMAGPECQLQDLHDFLVWFMLLRGQCFGVVDALAHSMF